MVENSFSGGDGFSMFKLPKISCLFDNNVSPGVGGAHSLKPYLKNGAVEINLGWRSCVQHVQMFQNQSFI
jgi:hypothetical protein